MTRQANALLVILVSFLFAYWLRSGNPVVGVALAFDSMTGRIYSIEYSTNLLQGTWGKLGANMPGTGAAISIEDTNDWARAYYRVEASRP